MITGPDLHTSCSPGLALGKGGKWAPIEGIWIPVDVKRVPSIETLGSQANLIRFCVESSSLPSFVISLTAVGQFLFPVLIPLQIQKSRVYPLSFLV